MQSFDHSGRLLLEQSFSSDSELLRAVKAQLDRREVGSVRVIKRRAPKGTFMRRRNRKLARA